MQSIEKHITDLFRKHDCVIIPDFGGFLLSYKPARIAPSGNEILPPSRTVSFNRNLANNDGLLANSIAQKEQITFSEALNLLKEKVDIWKSKILISKELRLDDIGVLSLNSEDKWQFQPSATQNFLSSSFGLSTLQLVVDEPETIKLKSVENLNKAIRSQTSGNSPIRTIAIAATVLVVLGLSSFFLIDYLHQSYPLAKKDKSASADKTTSSIQQANINIQQPEDVMPTTNPAESKVEKKIETPAPVVQPPVEEEVKVDIHPIVKQTVKKSFTISVEIPVKHQDAAAFENGKYNFYIVGGSFTLKQNAQRFAKGLKKKGYDAEILENNEGMFRVTYHKDADSLTAASFMQDVRSENQSAWILKW